MQRNQSRKAREEQGGIIGQRPLANLFCPKPQELVPFQLVVAPYGHGVRENNEDGRHPEGELAVSKPLQRPVYGYEQSQRCERFDGKKAGEDTLQPRQPRGVGEAKGGSGVPHHKAGQQQQAREQQCLSNGDSRAHQITRRLFIGIYVPHQQ